jgi:hypothetical protein
MLSLAMFEMKKWKYPFHHVLLILKTHFPLPYYGYKNSILYIYLFQTKISMSGGNGFSEFMRQWVQHGMMWMHRRQPIFVKLLSYNAD